MMIFAGTWFSRWKWGQLNRRGESDGARRCLVVFVPGVFATMPQPWEYNDLLSHFDEVLWRRFHARDWLPFHYLATFWSPSSPDAIAQQLVAQIDNLTEKQDYDAVLLIAHSFGGLILRRAVLQARARPWFGKVERVVLLASTSRGLIPATPLQRLLTGMGKRAGADRWLIGRLALLGLKPSAWLDELSQQWRAWLTTRDGQAPVVRQIQGDRDRVIELSDDADLGVLPGVREEILPGVGHRYFLLKPRWLQTADPVAANALQAVSRALERAVLD